MTYKSWPTADQQHDEQGRTDVVGAFLIDPTTGQPYAASGGGGGGAATIADGADVAQGATTDAANANTVVGQLKQGNAVQGTQADTAATSDTGTFSLIALVKRLLQSLTTIGTNTTGVATAANQTTGNTNTSAITTAIGAQADAAITNSASSGSLLAFAKGIVSLLSGVLQVKRSTVAVYSLASTATTSSSNSGDLTVGPYTEISLDINTTAQTGTNPTIQFFYKRKAADGLYYTLWQSNVLTAAANTISTSIGAGTAYNQSLGVTGQLTWTIGGTATPGFTFSANIQGK